MMRLDLDDSHRISDSYSARVLVRFTVANHDYGYSSNTWSVSRLDQNSRQRESRKRDSPALIDYRYTGCSNYPHSYIRTRIDLG